MFKIYDGRKSFYQWDLNQKVIVETECSQVHFCNRTGDCSLVVDTYELNGKTVANVPNLLLQSAKNITIFAYLCDGEEQYTLLSEVFSVTQRTRPDDYAYTETEIRTWNALEERIAELEENGTGGTADSVEEGNMNPVTSGAVFIALNAIENRLLPEGGDEGQVLKKVSDDNYNTAWGDTVILTYTGNGLTVL